MNFKDKSIFLWVPNSVESGDPNKIALKLKTAGFEGVYLHAESLGIWRTRFPVTLIAALKQIGIRVYGSAAVYGETPATEGHQAGSIVNAFQLDGFVFDAESGFDAKPNAAANSVEMIKAYKGMTDKPCAWCWWPLFKSSNGLVTYHDKRILREAMTVADYGMPMAYWSWGNASANVLSYLNESWKQWREVTAKPLIAAGRAYIGDGGIPTPEAIKTFYNRALTLGAHAISWWSMQHAVAIQNCWEALTEVNTNITQGEVVNNNSLGLFTASKGWTNKDFEFIAGLGATIGYTPNSEVAGIQAQAEAEGKPFLLWLKFSVIPWTSIQIGFDKMPAASADPNFQQLVTRVLGPRSYSAVVLEVMDEIDFDGKSADKLTVSKMSHIVANWIAAWLIKNRPGVQFVLATSNDFINSHAPDIGSSWAHLFNSCAMEPRAYVQLASDSYPVSGDKPYYLGARNTCEFWRYFELTKLNQALILYRYGDKASLYKWLNFQPGSQPPVTPDPGDTGNPGDPKPPVVAVTVEDFIALTKRVEELERWRKS